MVGILDSPFTFIYPGFENVAHCWVYRKMRDTKLQHSTERLVLYMQSLALQHMPRILTALGGLIGETGNKASFFGCKLPGEHYDCLDAQAIVISG